MFSAKVTYENSRGSSSKWLTFMWSFLTSCDYHQVFSKPLFFQEIAAALICMSFTDFASGLMVHKWWIWGGPEALLYYEVAGDLEEFNGNAIWTVMLRIYGMSAAGARTYENQSEL